MPKYAMTPREIFMFDLIIPFNSTMVGGKFENLELDVNKMQ